MCMITIQVLYFEYEVSCNENQIIGCIVPKTGAYTRGGPGAVAPPGALMEGPRGEGAI